MFSFSSCISAPVLPLLLRSRRLPFQRDHGEEEVLLRRRRCCCGGAPPQSFISSRQEQLRRLKAPAAQLPLGLATETRGKRLRLHPETLDKHASQQDASVSAAAGRHQPHVHAAEMGTVPEIKAKMFPAVGPDVPRGRWDVPPGRRRSQIQTDLEDFRLGVVTETSKSKKETFGFDAASK